jgi:hypothetical protein
MNKPEKRENRTVLKKIRVNFLAIVSWMIASVLLL